MAGDDRLTDAHGPSSRTGALNGLRVKPLAVNGHQALSGKPFDFQMGWHWPGSTHTAWPCQRYPIRHAELKGGGECRRSRTPCETHPACAHIAPRLMATAIVSEPCFWVIWVISPFIGPLNSIGRHDIRSSSVRFSISDRISPNYTA